MSELKKELQRLSNIRELVIHTLYGTKLNPQADIEHLGDDYDRIAEEALDNFLGKIQERMSASQTEDAAVEYATVIREVFFGQGLICGMYLHNRMIQSAEKSGIAEQVDRILASTEIV